MRKSPLRAGCRVWFYREGAPGVFGDGKARLLASIQRAGSLKQACEATGISYRKAWGDLRKAEACLGVALLYRVRGGRGGGGTKLTPAAIHYLRIYRRFQERVRRDLDARARQFQREVKGAD
jgi:molybdate transport system regulatory protein